MWEKEKLLVTSNYEQFLLFPQCFQKAFFPEASSGVTVWEWVNSLPQNGLLTTVYKKPIENLVGKGKNAGYQHFLRFPLCFLPFPKQNLIVQ